MTVLRILLLSLGLGLLAAPASAAPAPAPRPRPATGLAEIRQQLAEVRSGLARLDSVLDQVKDLHLRLVRLGQVVDRLERVAQAPADLDRRIGALAKDVADLGRRVEALRLEGARLRAPVEDAGGGSGLRAGYHEGFYLASRSGAYKLRLNGVLRMGMDLGQATGPEALRPEEPVHKLGFTLPNAILQLGGHLFTKKLEYYLEMELGADGAKLNDFFFTYRPSRFFGVSFGQYPVQFTQQQYNDPYDIIFASTSSAALLFGLGRDIGVRLHFWQWNDRVFQELSIFNGGGQNALENDNVDFLYQLRAGVLPFGGVPDEEGDFRLGARPLRLRVQGGYVFLPMPTGRDLDGKDGMDTSFVHQAMAEVSLWWRGFFLNGELYVRHEDRGAAVTQLAPPEKRRENRYGGYGQAAYFIRRIKLGLVGRYSYAQPVAFWRRNDDALVYGWSSPLGAAPGTVLAADGQPEALHEVTAGLVFFAFGRHLKLVLSYTWLYEQGYRVEGRATTPSRQVHLATLFAQARF